MFSFLEKTHCVEFYYDVTRANFVIVHGVKASVAHAAHPASVAPGAGLVREWGRGLRFREHVHDLVIEFPVSQRFVELIASHPLVFLASPKQELASQLGVSFR